MPDHVHRMISIPQKDAVSKVMRDIKLKSAMHSARIYWKRKQNILSDSIFGRAGDLFVSAQGGILGARHGVSRVNVSCAKWFLS